MPPIDRSLKFSAEQQIYLSLRDALIAGRITAGDALTIRSLAQLLKISPAPVRGALSRLEAEGALKARPNSAFYALDLNADQFEHLLQVRLQLEGYASRQAARLANQRDIRRIEDAAARWDVALRKRPQDLAPANRAFHFAIYNCAHNPVLLNLIETLWVRIGPVIGRIRSGGALRVANDAHAGALKAIKARDPAAAEAAIRDDLEQGGAMIKAALQDRERGGITSAA